MENPTAGAPWDDPRWIEKGDNSLQRKLRRHQGWYRDTVLQRPAGTRLGGSRLVVSMLPDDDQALENNLWTPEARASLQEAVASLRNRPGKIETQRVARNLLSSQPLCFNLFGYLRQHPEAALPWLRSLAPEATSVMRIELEWSTAESAVGGSAFDAFLEYNLPEDRRGFLGVECKHHEDLKASQRSAARPVYREETVPPAWHEGAADHLDVHGLRQFWYNTLLALRMQRVHGYAESRSVVVGVAEDAKAREAVRAVGEQLTDPDFIAFCSMEDVVTAVPGHDRWKRDFSRRYLDYGGSA